MDEQMNDTRFPMLCIRKTGGHISVLYNIDA